MFLHNFYPWFILFFLTEANKKSVKAVQTLCEKKCINEPLSVIIA